MSVRKENKMTKPCCDSDNNNDLNEGAWSKEEDQKLINHVTTHCEVCWRTLPQAAGSVCVCARVNVMIFLFLNMFVIPSHI